MIALQHIHLNTCRTHHNYVKYLIDCPSGKSKLYQTFDDVTAYLVWRVKIKERGVIMQYYITERVHKNPITKYTQFATCTAKYGLRAQQ